MKCPLDIQKCLFVHRTNRNVHWTFKRPFVHWTNRNVQWTLKCSFVQWTNGHCLIANMLVFYPHEVYGQSYYVNVALLSDAVKVTCPLDIMKCPLDVQECLFVHRTNRNVHWTNKNVQWTLKCSFVQWTDGRMDIV